MFGLAESQMSRNAAGPAERDRQQAALEAARGHMAAVEFARSHDVHGRRTGRSCKNLLAGLDGQRAQLEWARPDTWAAGQAEKGGSTSNSTGRPTSKRFSLKDGLFNALDDALDLVDGKAASRPRGSSALDSPAPGRASPSPPQDARAAAGVRRRAPPDNRSAGTEGWHDGKLAAFTLFKELKAEKAPTIEQKLKEKSRWNDEVAAAPDLHC